MDWKMTSSVLATIMFVRSLPQLIPTEIYVPIKNLVQNYVGKLVTTTVSLAVEEYPTDTYSSTADELFEAVHSYLGSKTSAATKLKIYRSMNSKNMITYSLEPDEQIVDEFEDFKVKWTCLVRENRAREPIVGSADNRCYQLTFNGKNREAVETRYLAHVIEQGRNLQFMNREKNIWTNRSNEGFGDWRCVPFNHPSTLDTLALDEKLKEDIMQDLDRFVTRKEYYMRVGRAWKRGYLLHGPPGTGKTSLIAAIANHLNYDIYDLELLSVRDNAQLRRLLLQTKSKSVVVVEDIDCTVGLSNRGVKRGSDGTESRSPQKESVSLSGVLNVIDGLWSCCEGERLMVFTTNHKENLDPALLRPGRMDKHIYMGYCGFDAFKKLVSNYLNVEQHELMEEVKDDLPAAEMTPADIAEVLIGCNDDPDVGMRTVVDRIKRRRLDLAAAAAPHPQQAPENGEDDVKGKADDEDGTEDSNAGSNDDKEDASGRMDD